MDFHLLLIFVNLFLAVFSVSAGQTTDERAIQVDKDPVSGRLDMHPTLGVVFRVTDELLIPAQRMRRIENTAPAPIAPGTSPAHRIFLWGTESICGTIQSVEEDQIWLATPAGDRLCIPAALVHRVQHFQGDAVLLRDDFETDETARRLTGQAGRSTAQVASGRQSVRLAAVGDAVEYRLPQAIGSGWFEARFWDSGEVQADRHWFCELDFDSNVGVRMVQVSLGFAAESYALATPHGPSLPVQRIARRPGWSRLAVRFQADRITVLINEAVLTHRAVGIGSLTAVRFAVRDGEPGEIQTPVNDKCVGYVDDLQIAAAQAIATERQPARNLDDLLLANGDQLFGRLQSATNREVTIEAEFGTHSVAWSDVQSLHLSPRRVGPRTVEGQRVRLEYVATASHQSSLSESDLLEGILKDVTGEALRLEHAYLGLVTIPRAQMRNVEFLASGRWLAIDPGFQHFGEQVNVRFQVPHPGGPERTWLFELADEPAEAALVVHVVSMRAMPAAEDATKRSTGGSRSYAAINGRLLDPLGFNHLLTLNYRSPARLSVPIAPGILRKGENTLRIFQTPEPDDPQRYDDCGIFGIGLELSKP